MINTLIYILILACLCSIPNYISYKHIQQYKFYKQVHSLSFGSSIVGLLLGLPFLVYPYALTERDQSFVTYKKVKNSLLFARIATAIFFIGSIYMACNWLFNR